MSEQRLFLQIAGIRIRVESDGALSEDPGILAEYLTGEGSCDVVLRAELAERLPEPVGAPVYTDPALRVYDTGSALRRYIGTAEDTYLCAEHRPGEVRAWFRQRKLRHGITSKLLLAALDLPHLLASRQGILLHASFIEYEGRAILFPAPSETGKSTQAALWCNHAGAALINGDRAAVCIRDGQVLACGTPYSGSSPVRRNVQLPLGAIVCLSQAPENTIHRLRGLQAFRPVWQGCTVNVWDRHDLDQAARTVGEAVSLVPVYHLACTPDVRAVELLKHTMEVGS